jgi:hypothetical protein
VSITCGNLTYGSVWEEHRLRVFQANRGEEASIEDFGRKARKKDATRKTKI